MKLTKDKKKRTKPYEKLADDAAGVYEEYLCSFDFKTKKCRQPHLLYRAFLLGKRAAMLLADKTKIEPERSKYFLSAIYMAQEDGLLEEVKELTETALRNSNNKNLAKEIQDTIDKCVSLHSQNGGARN